MNQTIRRARASAPPPLRPHLKSLAPYLPGKPIEEVERELGLAGVIKLASNENPLGPSPKAVRAMADVLSEMNLYPDGGGYNLKRELARRLNVRPEEIILGNGSDEVTLFLALCYLGPGRSMVTSQYAFLRYEMAGRLAEAETRLVPMKDLRHDTRALAAAVDASTTLLFIDNPCNPTGTILRRSELARLARDLPSSLLIVLDEAYHEFAANDPDYPDGLALRRRHPNLIVTRTFSKAYGLAGLRIGYGVADPTVVADLERVRPPFNVNRIAQAAALAALGDRAHLRRSVLNNERGKRYLGVAFGRLGLAFTPTHANFFLVDFGSRGLSGATVYERLLRRGVVVRPMGGYGLKSHVRVSIGAPEENRRLVAELKALLGSSSL